MPRLAKLQTDDVSLENQKATGRQTLQRMISIHVGYSVKKHIFPCLVVGMFRNVSPALSGPLVP